MPVVKLAGLPDAVIRSAGFRLDTLSPSLKIIFFYLSAFSDEVFNFIPYSLNLELVTKKRFLG